MARKACGQLEACHGHTIGRMVVIVSGAGYVARMDVYTTRKARRQAHRREQAGDMITGALVAAGLVAALSIPPDTNVRMWDAVRATVRAGAAATYHCDNARTVSGVARVGERAGYVVCWLLDMEPRP